MNNTTIRESSVNPIHIIPRPLSLEPKTGECILTPETIITWNGPGSEPVAQLLAEYLRPATGYPFPVKPVANQNGLYIHLITEGNPPSDDAGFFSERHVIDISPGGVTLSAETPSGLSRGIQSLRQLLPPEIFSTRVESGPWPIPCARIIDEPRLRWRGLHLDVSRHFFSVAEVCRFIELLALHRFNMCHLHLTDDQGWRVEILKYPRLTEIGAYREQTLIGYHEARPRRYDGLRYGGFYTQLQIREIVAFASRRHVTVVPEIEMPGHAQAMIAAYPQLGNLNGALKPRCHWGVSQHVLNVEPSTLEFMRDVLDEVMGLFPSRFIHIGGDEAPKYEWSESPRAQARMVELGLTSEDRLQSWFIEQMCHHIGSAGRRLIGWDEILEGGLPSNATVMSWRGEEGGIKAAKLGHDVVMAPEKWVYLNFYQAYPLSEEPLAIDVVTAADKVYAYEPVPAALSDADRKHVLGAQGQLWSEYITSRDELDYMTYPRACALAEVLWIDAEQKNYADFLTRLSQHRQRLQRMGVNAHPRP